MGQTKAQKIARRKPRNANKQFVCKESEEELNSEEIWTELIATQVDQYIFEEEAGGCKLFKVLEDSQVCETRWRQRFCNTKKMGCGTTPR
jgi:hypothetical protein